MATALEMRRRLAVVSADTGLVASSTIDDDDDDSG
jgi:hypothetical protein